MTRKFSKVICMALALMMVLSLGSVGVFADAISNVIADTIAFDADDTANWETKSQNGVDGGVDMAVLNSDGTEGAWTSGNTSAGNVLKFWESKYENATGNKYQRELRWFDAVNKTSYTGIVEQQFDLYVPNSNTTNHMNVYVVDSTGRVSAIAFNLNFAAASGFALRDQYVKYTAVDTLSYDKWYTYKIAYDTVSSNMYLFYKLKGDTQWTFADDLTMASGSYKFSELYKTGVASNRVANVAGIMFSYNNAEQGAHCVYIDNYNAKVTSLAGLHADTGMWSSLIKNEYEATGDLTANATTATRLETSKVINVNGSNITVYEFSVNIPDTTKLTANAQIGVTSSSGTRKGLCTILKGGGLRVAIAGTGFDPYHDVAVFSTGDVVDFKVLMYADTQAYDILFKKSTESEYKSMAELLNKGEPGKNKAFMTRLSTDKVFTSPKNVYFNTWASSEPCTVNMTDIKMTTYSNASAMMADAELFKAYINECYAACLVEAPYTTDTNAAAVIAKINEIEAADAATTLTNEEIFFLADKLPAFLAATSISDYAGYAAVANQVAGAAKCAEALAAAGYTALATDTAIQQCYLVESLAECAPNADAAGMHMYYKDAEGEDVTSPVVGNTAYLDAVSVGRDGIVFIAAYDADKIIGISNTAEVLTKGTVKTINYTIPAGADKLKAFVWTGKDTLYPLHSALESASISAE